MDLYFTDRKFNLLGIASTDSDAPIQFDNDTDVLSIDAASRTLTATLHFNDDSDEQVTTMGASGNFILYRDLLGRFVFMEIMEFTHDPLAGTHVIVAQDAGVDLLDETVGSFTATKAYNIEWYINKFTADSGWQVGINEISNLTRTLKWDSDDETALARILSVATQFDGAEIAFSFDFDDAAQTIKKYINIYKKRGAEKDLALYVNRDLNNLTTTENIYDLCTSIKGTGGTPDGKDKPVTLVGYKWTDKNWRYVLGSDGILRDTVAVQSWSRILSNSNPTPNSHHLQRVKTYEAVSQATLLQSVLADLKKYNHPTRSYEADIVTLPDGVDVGDTVHLAYEDEDTYLSTRLLTLTECYSLGTATAEFGDFVIEESQISPELQALADTLKQQVASKQYYPWTMYADDDQGTGMSPLASGKKYMAVVWSTNATPSDNAADYAGHWLAVGKDGTDGQPGAKGADGKTSYFHTAWADDVNGTTGFTTAGGDGKSYIGAYSDFTEADSDDPTKYKWALFKGDKGADGLDGPKGADGVSSYTHIAYSDSATGTTGFSQTPGSHTYIGFYVDSSPTNSTTPSQYKWSLIKGADGANGTAGPAGADGKTPYFHQAWSTSPTGSTGFSTTVSTGKTYWGTYTDFTQTDSTTPSAYKWVETAGAAEANAKTYTDTQVKPVADKVAELIPAPSSGTTYPAAPVTGQQFWLVQGSAASLYQYDGSKWQAVQLDAKTLNEETFNGMTFNGVTFNGSQFISQYSGEMYDWSSDGYSTKPGSAFSRLSDVGYQVSANWYSDSLKSDVTTEGMITPAGEYIGLFAKGKYDATSDAPSQGLVSLSPVDQSLTLLTPDNVGGTLTAKMLGEMVASGTKLWSGALAMADKTTLTLPKKISQCLNGIVLLWVAGNASGASTYDYTMTFIPKWFAADYSGGGINCFVGSASRNAVGIKYIYVTDTTLRGYETNTQNEAAKKVLQGVYEY